MKNSKLSKFQSEKLDLDKSRMLAGGAIDITLKTQSNKKVSTQESLITIVIHVEETDDFIVNI